jgi:2,3-diketo-5-methylthiopentyl-1-phosphate enolase
MLLSTVIGNISMFGALKLLDLSFPKRFIEGFRGPKFGVPGVRKLLGVYERPLLNNMIKPCTGFPPEVGARLFLEAARGGCDIIKDDELIADAPFSPLEQRVKLYMEAARKASEEKGEQTLYTVNITDRADKVRDNALRCVDAGANALMINYLTAGISTLHALAEDPAINVPILAHLDFAGTMYESPHSGMSSHLILGKLARMAGADMVIYPNPYGKIPFLREKHIKIALCLRQPFHGLAPVLPGPGGSVQAGMVPYVMGDLGNDCMISAGGAVHAHPLGPAAGAKAMRQAMDAARQGVDLDTYASERPELKAAIAAWGSGSKMPRPASGQAIPR